jgi:phenylacetate-CoA ligase
VANSKYLNIIRLLRNERRSMDELISYQNAALRKLVNHAYSTVTFYKKLYDEHCLHPKEIQSIEDISKIPVIDKKMLIKNTLEDLISSKFKKENLIRITTSGSSGIPLEFFIDHSFDQHRKAQYLRPYITNGQRLWDRSISFSYHKVPEKKWLQHFGLMVNHTIFSGRDLNAQIKALQDIKPAIIQAYGSVFNLLSNKIANEQISIPKPRLIFTDSEVLMPEVRLNIEKVFEAPIIDIYGTWETDNIAYECQYHKGYHIAMDSVIMEFLYDGKPVNPGEEGEVVVTVLNNFSQPFIRYNLKDIASYCKDQCPCGRTFPLITQIKGRTNDYMITEDGNRISFFNYYFKGLAPHVYEYQIIQEDLNLLTIFIVPGKSYNDEAEKIFIPIMRKFFPNAKIDIKLVSSIEREPSGKFKAFKSLMLK